MEYGEDEGGTLEYNRKIIREGLVLHEKYAKTAEAQETERDTLEEYERARGRDPGFILTDEERAWNENRDRHASVIAFHKKHVMEQLDLVPGKSVLFQKYNLLLRQACNPESVIVYDSALREFGMMETWVPAKVSIGYCPFTGKKLPTSLRDQWFDRVNATIGNEDWSIEQAKEQVPGKYFNEQWWIELDP